MNNSQSLSSQEQAQLQQFAKHYDPAKGLLKDPYSQQWAIAQRSVQYATLLFRRGEAGDHARAIDIITAALDAQLHTPDWDRGRFPFLIPETWRDLNANLFMTPYLVEINDHWIDKLPPDLAVRFKKALHDVVNIVERRWSDELFDPHRDFVAYSNIFIIYIRALYMLGKALDIPRLTHDALYQWRRWFNHTSIYGVDEFTSPTYIHVVYEGLLDIHALVADEPSVRKEMALVLDHLYVLQHAVNHPLMRVEAVGVSRDYRLFVPPGQGAFTYLEYEGSHGYTPPAGVAAEFNNRKFPYRASGRAAATPFLFKTWQDINAGIGAAMGSMTGGNYFPQQIHLMAAVGTSPEDRACAFMNAEPSNPLQGYVSQNDHRALCLFARTPNPYVRYQGRTAPKTLPLEGTLPPCLALTQGWVSQSDEPGVVKACAYGHTLHVRAFTLEGDRLTPMALSQVKVEVGRDMVVDGWRADSAAVWTAFLVELLPDGQTPEPVSLQGKITADAITLNETGGLGVKLFRRPQGKQNELGELVEIYDVDWRTLPLFQTPDHTLHAGDLIAASVDDQ